MIKQLEYYKQMPRLSGGLCYNNIVEFIEAIRREMESEGNVMLVLEPGDATHYEFLIIQCGVQLAIAAPMHGWSFFCCCDPITITPNKIEHETDIKINPYTLGVICQALHQVYKGDEQYYDWDKCIPIERVTPGDDNGEAE